MKKFDIDEIEVSSKLDKVVKNSIEDGLKEYKKEKHRKFLMKKGVTAASIILILGCVVLNSEFVSASAQKIRNTIESFSINSKPLVISEEYKTIIGDVKEDKNIKVTLNEFIVDEDIIFINTNLDSKKRKDYAQGVEPKVYVDGNLIDDSFGSTSSYIHNENGTVDILTAIAIKDLDIDRVFDVKIKYDKIQVTNKFDMERNIRGNWEYNFNVDGRELLEDVMVKEVNNSVVSENNSKVDIESIRVSPTKITMTAKELSEETVSLILVDEQGNEYRDYFVLNGNWYYMMNTEDIKDIKIVPAMYSESKGENILYEEGAITINLD